MGCLDEWFRGASKKITASARRATVPRYARWKTNKCQLECKISLGKSRETTSSPKLGSQAEGL
ncbi:MAG: hypothetical protein ACI87E_002266 [Mariniblastus sp.]|jgi:hypothetical protein